MRRPQKGHRETYLPNPSVLFWAKVDKTAGPESCWLWCGCIDSRGYGQLTVRRQKKKAHRYAWELTHGDPGHAWVLHACDIPMCVNPLHLFLGDSRLNVLDMHVKGRDRNGNESLTQCRRGHEFTAENTAHWRGKRLCRTCRRENAAKHRERNPEAHREAVRQWRRRQAGHSP